MVSVIFNGTKIGISTGKNYIWPIIVILNVVKDIKQI